MNTKEIIKLIKSKESWISSELTKTIKDISNKETYIEFCYIGGYECTKDGTKTVICKSLEDIQNILDDHDIVYNKSIKDPIKLARSIELTWQNIHDDAGGAAWINYNKDNNNV